MSRLASWLRAWRRMRLESQIARIDDCIDGIQAMRAMDEQCEMDLRLIRAGAARKLQALKQDNINHLTRDNVRALGK